jgi:hypothetical protein
LWTSAAFDVVVQLRLNDVERRQAFEEANTILGTSQAL